MSVCGKSFDELSQNEMEEIFGGTDENVQPRITTVFIPVSIKVSAALSATVSAVSGIVSYNTECLG